MTDLSARMLCASREVVAYGGGDGLKAVASLLRCIEEHHMQSMTTVKPEGLAFIQGAYAQAKKLREVIECGEGRTPSAVP